MPFEHPQEHIDVNQDAIAAATAAASAASAAAKASTATFAGSLALLGGWLVSSQAAALLGLLVGVAGLAVQWWYRDREYRMRRREHAAHMRREGVPMTDPGQ